MAGIPPVLLIMRDAKASMIRNAAVLIVQRVALILIGVVFAAVVPRLLGPQDYGKFALLLSLSIWGFIAGDLGLTQILSRQVPRLTGQMTDAETARIFRAVMCTRLSAGLAMTVLYFTGVTVFLPELERPTVLAFCAAMSLGAILDPMMSWLVGLHRADLWGLSFLIRRMLYLVCIPVGHHAAGLAGAAWGLAAAEAAVLLCGFSWARRHAARHLGLAWSYAPAWPLVRAGLLFHAGNLVGSAFRYTGETLVRVVTHDYAQVGYFGICLSVQAAAEAGLLQVSTACTPFLSSLAAEGRVDELRKWVERILTGLSFLSLVVLLGAVFLGHVVAPVVFGSDFAPSVPNLYPLAATLTAIVASATANILAVIFHRPRVYLGAAALRLAIFWSLGSVAAAHFGSVGASWAILFAASLGATFAVWSMREHFRNAWRNWAMVLAGAVLFLPLKPLAHGPASSGLLFLVSAGLYTWLLVRAKILRAEEMRTAWRSLTG